MHLNFIFKKKLNITGLIINKILFNDIIIFWFFINVVKKIVNVDKKYIGIEFITNLNKYLSINELFNVSILVNI